jgi:hypothetical protein
MDLDEAKHSAAAIKKLFGPVMEAAELVDAAQDFKPKIDKAKRELASVRRHVEAAHAEVTLAEQELERKMKVHTKRLEGTVRKLSEVRLKMVRERKDELLQIGTEWEAQMAERRKEAAREELKADRRLTECRNAAPCMDERIRRAAESMKRVKKSVEAA